MEDDMIRIGNRIKQRRKAIGLTQTDIFQECGVSSGALSKIENGTRIPSFILFYRISQVLQCDMEWLITGESSNSQNNKICKKEEELLDGFRKLSAEDQEEMAEILKIKLRKQRNITGEKEKSYSLRDTEKNDIAG